ncbi:hypothetical protein Nepgr_023262 [Nepenthes gracilis]|uniref:Uncharacterized protein n=1 Tax=Nepenthes gracilis TaxID=150966 RepID=A0AAD3XYY3_NEPGR|nr:hypothetical protein Nepgr_023262 [Nepenthes gracilis]
MAGFSAYKAVIYLFFVGSLLAIPPQKVYVSGLTSVDLALRRRLLPAAANEAVSTKDLDINPSPAPAPSTPLDQYRSCKRRVQRGSDPIHNRC